MLWSRILCFIAVSGLICDRSALAAAHSDRLTPDPQLTEIQEQLASLDAPGGYYATTYRKSEALYWSNLPAWMRTDARSHHAGRVLDIGCGYGTLLALAAEIYAAEPYCIDVIRYIPEFGRLRGFHFETGNIQLDPVPAPASFDIILMTEVLEHFNFAPLPAMKKIHDALAENGVFFLSTPDAAEWGRQTKYYSRLRDIPPADPTKPFVDDHIWVYNKKELFELIKDAGFIIDKFAYSPGAGHRHFNLELRRAPERPASITP